jgi:EAL and modified HD-GYP domain-containing signal transduction protein
MAAVVAGLARRGVTVIADGLASRSEFERAAAYGCELFAGNFLSRPDQLEGRQAPGTVRTYSRLLAAVADPEPDYDALEDAIKADVSLSHRFLRYLNSAAHGWQREITSIRHGLVLLGQGHVRRWVSLSALAGAASHHPPELVVTAVLRARLCELIGASAGHGDRQLDLFMVGMFSLLDVILGQPLDTALDGVPLSADALAALHGERNTLRQVLDVVTAYEAAQWHRVAPAAELLGIPVPVIAGHYLAAVGWADGLVGGTGTVHAA